MNESRQELSFKRAADDPLNDRFADATDASLIDLMLEQSISDRLRSLCRYVNALEGFRRV